MNEKNDQQFMQFSSFAKKKFKKIPKDVLPGLWSLHENISETFSEELSRLICQFYLDTQAIIGETAENAKKITSSIKANATNLKQVISSFDKVNFADLPPPEVLRQEQGPAKPIAPPPKPE